MENLKNRVDDLFEDYQGKARTTGYGDLETKSNNQNWIFHAVNSAIDQTLEKFRDYHLNNIKTVETMNSEQI